MTEQQFLPNRQVRPAARSPYPEHLRQQFEGVIWKRALEVPLGQSMAGDAAGVR
ncbi:hypothetical protein [Streptomyces sp. NRRL S-1813]|uniref:hypothetical protein n=1 Tax=Streptomyces sp. NRRL S-1813 TaxID=1463888 RepID=UPI000A61ADB3|nr:hypothetical protein [Streptomyces sp. NRRL S-1813]